MVDTFLEQMNVSIVPFGTYEALTPALDAVGNWDFKVNARDYSIAKSVQLKGQLVTYNTRL